MRMAITLTLAVLLTLPFPSAADEDLTAVEAPPVRSVFALSKGDSFIAPFDGQFMELTIAAALAVKVEMAKERCDKRVTYEKKMQGLEHQAELGKKVLDLDRTRFERDQFAKASEDHWYESPILWYVLGVASAAVVVIGVGAAQK